MAPRRISVLTGSRAEYGILYWTMKEIRQDPDLELLLLVTGMHLSPEFGLTIKQIEADGFPIAARAEMVMSSDTAEGVATSIGIGVLKLARALAITQPDLLVVLEDRPEVLAGASAALPLQVPVAHIHGGESSEGAIDESIRHAVTKLSHLHFASTRFYAQRILQMSEEPWRVHVIGAPGLEHIHRTALPSLEELEQKLGLDLTQPTLLITYHPVTLPAAQPVAVPAGVVGGWPDKGDLVSPIDDVLWAVQQSGLQAVITYPNADQGGRAILEGLREFQAAYPKAKVFANLGSPTYLGLMQHVAAMVGNSSSGIIEAASFGVPVVNIGDRQKGRLRAENVIDALEDKESILKAIGMALEPGFRARAKQVKNPYDHGYASKIILKVIKEVELGPGLLRKKLVDLPSTLQLLSNGVAL